MNRRQFLGSSAVAATGLAVPSAYGEVKKRVAANDKIAVALIGCGGMGNGNLADFVKLPDFEVVALCDIDSNRFGASMNILRKAGRSNSNVATFEDYRKMIDERKDLDAVIIGTPDHHHAFALTYACIAGKGGSGLDVYCEKPLSHNIVEGRAMVNAARKNKKVVQIGTQQRSGKHFKDAVAYVQSGKLGHVYMCRTWITNNDAKDYGNPPDTDQVPQGANYDLWLGPAPLRKFNPLRFHYDFRWWFDYGNGLCNDWGVHLNDIILWGMKDPTPIGVSAIGGKFEVKDPSDTPDTLDVFYEYPGFTHVYTVRRGKTHALRSGHGMMFQGTNGTLLVDRSHWEVNFPDGRTERHGGSEQHFAHVKNFLHCLRNRSDKTASDIEDMHRATVTAHLANISYKVKRKIYWDAQNERCYRGWNPVAKKYVHEDMDANALLFREPRAGWKLMA